ncbi:MAG: hypothetical protein DVB31_17415 [Verrucomicrobia bacterium]|nr:MAG: hypothetical protein DVB31_17415 [Verrucomicrobiota bacterium]
MQTISFGATATESVTVGYMGALTLVDDQIEWSDSNRSANRTFRITPGTTPGDYLFTAGTGGWEPRPAPPWWRCAW